MRKGKTPSYNTILELLRPQWKIWLRFSFLIFTCCFSFIQTSGASEINITSEAETVLAARYSSVYLDETNELNIHQIHERSTEFEKNTLDLINAQVTSATVWIKFEVRNASQFNDLYLELRSTILDEVTLYKLRENHFKADGPYGQNYNFSERFYDHPHLLFNLELLSGEFGTFYLKIKNADQITVPLKIGVEKTILEELHDYDVANGIYLGIFLVMWMYNLFLYFTTRNRAYLLYSTFVFTIGIALFTIAGYSFKYIWPGAPVLEQRAFVMVSAAIPVTALAFAISFLKLKVNLPLARKILLVFIVLYTLIFVGASLGFIPVSQNGIYALSISIFIIFGVALILAKRGIREAKFYLGAWTVYLIGIVVFLLKDFGVLPYNNFTNRMMHFGSALEVVLLSFALGDYINTLRKEKEKSQKEALAALKKNERIIREQNVVLEKKVKERTLSLETANDELSHTMNELKDAQIQLVDAEKMASLGQLTAGIAHEINNPINFVSSNISPLKRDIEDLKEIIHEYQSSTEKGSISEKDLARISDLIEDIDYEYTVEEIDTLLDGIKEGAHRTAEIVKGLKNFSRLDESQFKAADVNEGLTSTLLILQSKSAGINIIQKYEATEEIECLPGKLNQLFMNVLDNSIFACNAKNYTTDERPEISIKTKQDSNTTTITIADNGIGMSPEVKNKVFEPFFTTKNVGEGTGLGMSIAHGIITNHEGTITINSNLGKGTELIIHLPRVTNNSKSTL